MQKHGLALERESQNMRTVKSFSKSSEAEPGLEPEHEREVLAPDCIDGSEVINDSTSPGFVQSSPRDFCTYIRSAQIST